MRPWRNRQTRTFEGRMGDRMSSSLIGRTNKKLGKCAKFFFHCSRIATLASTRFAKTANTLGVVVTLLARNA